ncbi:MAG: hypothetical protein MZV64_50345 [Ignavibacteriales bacterium]|nr:hypothetical protein [Ignavibacteriales bacterium]
MDDPLDDYIEHIDCWAKFLDVDKDPDWPGAAVGLQVRRIMNLLPIISHYRQALMGNTFQVYRVYTPGTLSQYAIYQLVDP